MEQRAQLCGVWFQQPWRHSCKHTSHLWLHSDRSSLHHSRSMEAVRSSSKTFAYPRRWVIELQCQHACAFCQWFAGKVKFQAASAHTLGVQLVLWHFTLQSRVLPAGRILLSTIPENDSFLKKLLGVDMQNFKPSIPRLVSILRAGANPIWIFDLTLMCMHVAAFACTNPLDSIRTVSCYCRSISIASMSTTAVSCWVSLIQRFWMRHRLNCKPPQYSYLILRKECCNECAGLEGLHQTWVMFSVYQCQLCFSNMLDAAVRQQSDSIQTDNLECIYIT